MATQTPLVTNEDTMENLPLVTLPSIVAFKHSETGHFLAVVADGTQKDRLEFNADVNQLSQRAQFIVEMADNNWDVHLRSCYNNKYWVRESGGHRSFITATAVQPVDDKDAWNCTKFRTYKSVGSDGTKFYLYKPFVSAIGESEQENGGRQYLRTTLPSDPHVDVFAVDCTTPVLTLPKLVSFKGDNGKFLEVSIEESGFAYNVFKADDCRETRAVYEVVLVDDALTGSQGIINRFVRIKSYHFDKFLKRVYNDWIQGNSDDNGGNDTLFEVVKSPENGSTVIIRNVGNNKFCLRTPSSSDERPDFLNANGTQGDTEEAAFEVFEPVVSRDIVMNTADFQMARAFFYNHESFNMDHGNVANTFNEPIQMPIRLTFTKSRTSSWDNMETIKWDGSSLLRSHIPQMIGDFKVVLRGIHQGSYSWGQSLDESETIIVHHEVLVPPRTAVFATLVAKKGTCKVPFSYLQTDQLTTGIHKTYNKDDGVYIGTHVYAYDILEVAKPFDATNGGP